VVVVFYGGGDVDVIGDEIILVTSLSKKRGSVDLSVLKSIHGASQAYHP
jgi:hypothetical protein